MCLKILDGAVFISDAHHSKNKEVLQSFLQAIEQKEILPTQIFWMGDIFDLLVGGIEVTLNENQSIIQRINALKIPQFYFEGNHDFNLENVFPKITVFKRKQQPVIANIGEKKAALAHGDIFTPLGYNLYINTITNPYVLTVLNKMNINNWITNKISQYNYAKNLCKVLENFDKIIDIRIAEYEKLGVDIVIEGHFHQNVFKKYEVQNIFYINLSAFVCSQSFFIVKSENERLLIEQELRSNNG